MAGVDNLKPIKTTEEARKRGKNGGVASGKARRRKRAMKDAIKLLLGMPITSPSVERGLLALGFEEKDLTNQMAVIVSVWKEAMNGNISAASWLRDTSGENPFYQQQIEEFEYKKEKEQGISLEMEDMDEIEEDIYGQKEEKQEKDTKD